MKSTTTNRFFETLETRKLMSSSNITTDQPTDPAPNIATLGPPAMLSPFRDMVAHPGPAAKVPQAAHPTARRRRSAFRRADTNSRLCATIAAW